MGAALGIAERLLALERAVAELQTAFDATGASATGACKTPPGGATGEPEGRAGLLGAEQLAGVLGNARLAAVLVREGYGSPEALRAAGDAELLAIDGVSARALRLIREKLGTAGRSAAAPEEEAWT
jgi:hypothetical protein